MQNLKIRVNSEAESKEAQELFFDLGGKWGIGGRKIRDTDEPYLYLENGLVLHGFSAETFNTEQHKEATLPELRDMVLSQHSSDEPFLTPETTLNDQYAEIEQVRQVEIHGTVDATLTERQSQYGCYEDVAHVTQQILSALRVGNYDELPAPMKESLHMIASKMARIVNGDPEYLDNWHDIGGYAKLIEKLIKGE